MWKLGLVALVAWAGCASSNRLRYKSAVYSSNATLKAERGDIKGAQKELDKAQEESLKADRRMQNEMYGWIR
jgi:hypothetical protein